MFACHTFTATIKINELIPRRCSVAVLETELRDLGRLSFFASKEARQEIRTSLSLRGTLENCGEMLDLTCIGTLRRKDDHVTMDVTLSIRAVTLNFSDAEWMLGLTDGQLKNAVRWNKPNMERIGCSPAARPVARR